jgi:hypothetical protein
MDRLAARNRRHDVGVHRVKFPPVSRFPFLLREEVYVTQLHLPAKEKVERAEAAILETLVFGGLIATAIAAAIYDIGFWVGAW